MKTTIFLITLFTLVHPFSDQPEIEPNLTDYSIELSILIGEWQIDLSPEDPKDANYAKMIISSVAENSVEGFFYRDGVNIKEGRIAISQGTIYVALTSSDNSGTYNTSFRVKDDMLYGTTHSIDKDFLAVWNAVKVSE